MCNKTQKLISSLHPSLISKSAKSTLKDLAGYGNWKEGTEIRRSVSQIAKDTGWSERTIKRDRKSLKESGLIIKTRSHCKKIGLAEECRINFYVLAIFVVKSQELFKLEKYGKVIHRNGEKVCEKPVDKEEIGDRTTPEIGDRVAPLTVPVNCINTVGIDKVVDNFYESTPLTEGIIDTESIKCDSKPHPTLIALKTILTEKEDSQMYREATRYLVSLRTSNLPLAA